MPKRLLPLSEAAVQTVQTEAQWLQSEVCAPLGLLLDAGQLAKLVGFLDLLSSWNRAYNLTAVRDRVDMRVQHLADCLAVVGPVHRAFGARVAVTSCAMPMPVAAPSGELSDRTRALQRKACDALQLLDPASAPPRRVLDVGSGGGLPGVVLAIAFPSWQIHCVDAVAKKTAFVRQVAGALSLPNLVPIHGRVEVVQLPPCDLVVSRAFAALPLFTALTRRHLAPAGVWAAMKAKWPEAEIRALPVDKEVFHVEHLQVPGMDAERCLIWMRPAAT